MSAFDPCDYKILFKDDWNTRGLAQGLAELERQALSEEFRKLVREAPRRSESGKSYFVGHEGKHSTGCSNRGEELLALALWNHKGCWARPGGGWLRLLDYQFPLKAERRDSGIGKVDLLGLTDEGRIVVIELKVKPPVQSNRGETPARALIEGLRYAAIVKANLCAIAREAKDPEDCQTRWHGEISKSPPIVQVLAPKDWWKGWLNLGGSTRKAAGCWEREFSQLTRDIEMQLGVAVECVALSDADVTHCRQKPKLLRTPVLYSVDLAPVPAIGDVLSHTGRNCGPSWNLESKAPKPR